MFKDTFNRADTTQGLGVSDTGHTWSVDTGARIKDHRFVSYFVNEHAASYPRIDCGARVVRQAAKFFFNGETNDKALALICSRGDSMSPNLTYGGAWFDMLHLTVWPQGVQFNIYKAGLPGPMIFSEVVALRTDGTLYDIAINYNYELGTATIEMPDGTTRGPFYDILLAGTLGSWVIYETASFSTTGSFDFGFEEVEVRTIDDVTNFQKSHDEQIVDRTTRIYNLARRRYPNVKTVQTNHEDQILDIPVRRGELRYPALSRLTTRENLTNDDTSGMVEVRFYEPRFNHMYISDVLIDLEDGSRKYAVAAYVYATDELTMIYKDDTQPGTWSLFTRIPSDDDVG